MGNIIFDGYNFEDYGVVVSGSGTWNMPERRTVKDTIPGRHGALITEAGEFENVEIPYPAWIAHGFAEKYEEFTRMLAMHTDKYYRLEDTYHPDYYRMARVVPGITPETGTLNRSGSFTVAFDCKPQKWLRSGEEAVDVSAGRQGIKLFNPTPYDAKPLITAPQDVEITFSSTEGGVARLYTYPTAYAPWANIVYDADIEEATDSDGFGANEFVSQTNAITLKPGLNYIWATKDIKIAPRWYVI